MGAKGTGHVRHAVGARDSAALRQAGFALALMLGALVLLLSAGDAKTAVALLHSAATCWPGRIGGHH